MLSYVERRPGPRLQPYLECLWAVRDPTRARPARPPERIVPDGCPELIIHLADRFARRRSTGWVVQPRVFLAGTLTRPWTLRGGRRVDTIGARFRPGRAALVFVVPMAAATDRELRLADLVGSRAAATLMREVRAARTRDERFDAAERWLLARLARSGSQPGASIPAVDLILEERGRIRIDEVASRLGWSRRRIERAFARDLGIRPKLYARIVRLNAVLATLEPSQREAAVDVALEAGYFDQAHLLRDFRALAGRAPWTDRAGDGEMARHFTDPDRLRLLLAGE